MSITNDPFTAVVIGVAVASSVDRIVNKEYYEKEEEKRKKELEEERIRNSIRWVEKHSKPKQMEKDDIDNTWHKYNWKISKKIKYLWPTYPLKIIIGIGAFLCALAPPLIPIFLIPLVIIMMINNKLVEYIKRRFWMRHKNDYA